MTDVLRIWQLYAPNVGFAVFGVVPSYLFWNFLARPQRTNLYQASPVDGDSDQMATIGIIKNTAICFGVDRPPAVENHRGTRSDNRSCKRAKNVLGLPAPQLPHSDQLPRMKYNTLVSSCRSAKAKQKLATARAKQPSDRY